MDCNCVEQTIMQEISELINLYLSFTFKRSNKKHHPL